MAENGQYKFSIGLDGKQLEMDIAQAKRAFDSLVKQAKDAGAKIDGLINPFEKLGESAPQVAQATKQFNGLNVATQQLVRELPAASMGLNTFFLAVSNNLPILADQIKQVNAENKNLAAQGKPTTSVLKQIAGSLFSWQTALVLGVTALSMYGKEIGKWVVSLFKGKKSLDEVAQAEKALHEVRLKGTVDAQEEVTKIRLTVQAAQDATASIEERTNAIRALKSEYPDYFANLSDEQIMYGDVADSVQTLIDKTIALAQARKAFNQLVENEENMRLLESVEGYAKLRNELGRHAGSGHKKYRHTQVMGVNTGTMFLPTGYEYIESDDTKWNRTDGLTDSYKRVLDAQDTLLDNLEKMGKNGNKEAKALFEKISEEYDGDVKAYIDAVRASNEQLNTEAGLYVTSKDGENKSAIKAAEREAERKKREAERLKKERERRAKESAELSQKLQNEADQAEIEAMAEGTDKVIAQIKFNYEKRKQAIDKVAAELAAKQGGTLTEEQQGWVNEAYKGNKMQAADEWEQYVEEQVESAGAALKAEKDALKAEEAVWAEHLINYGTYKERLKATTDKYAIEIANAKNDAERKTLEAERDALLAEYKVQASDWANNLVDMTTAQLNKMLVELQGQVEAKEQAFNALDSSDSEDAKKYREEITKLKAQIAVLNEELGKTSRKTNDKNWDESVQTFQNIANSAMEAADGIAELDEDLGNILRSIAQLAGAGLNLVTSIKTITDAARTGATAISAMEKASLILTAISAGIQVVSTLFNLFRQSDEVEETKRQFKELNDELVRFRKLAQIDSVEGTIFGPNPFGNFLTNLQAVQDALKDFEASKEAIMNQMHGGVRFGNDGKPVMEFNPYDNLKDAISDMRVKTKDRNWLGEWLNDGDEYADLGDLMPDLFDEFGNVTLEGLQNLQNSDVWEDLGKKDRELIEQMIADWEDYNAAVEATEKYLSDVFGDLGYTMTNALVDAFENGTDAAQAFGEAASDVIEKLATDMIHAALVQPILDKYQQLIDEANLEEMSPEERIAELTRLIGEMSQEVLAVKGEVDATAAQVRQDAEDAGITGVYDGSSSSSVTSKGFQTMSQETGSELNGRFTDIQGQTHRIAEAVEFNKSMQQQQTLYLQSVSETLAAIKTDTDSIEKHTRTLARIDANIDSMRRTMDNGGGI